MAEKGGRSILSKLSHILPQPKNDVMEYLRGINVVSCGGNGRKWTKFVSRKLRRALCSVGYMQYSVGYICNVQYTAILPVFYALHIAVSSHS